MLAAVAVLDSVDHMEVEEGMVQLAQMVEEAQLVREERMLRVLVMLFYPYMVIPHN